MLIRSAILPATLAALCLAAGDVRAQATGQIAYVEEQVVTYRPVQQHVIVPVREYQTRTRLHHWWHPLREAYWAPTQVPVTRWEERIQTTYVSAPQRRYRPVIETSLRQAPPLILAERPKKSGAASRGTRLHDDLPMVAIAAPPPGTRTAQTPSTSLVPHDFKPAARSPAIQTESATPGELRPGGRGSTWSR